MTRWKPAVGFEILAALGDQIGKFIVDIGFEVAPQQVEIDAAGAHDGGGILVVDQGQQQMFERRIFVVAFIGDRQSAVQRLFETA